MSISTFERTATIAEMAVEMDRRGAAIERLEAKLEELESALVSIDAVGVDFGHFEDAARTMQDIARKALGFAA